MSAKSPWFSLAAVILALAMLNGCARIHEGAEIPPSMQESPTMSNYWPNRGYDAMDIFRIQYGVPRDFKGIGLTVKLTALLQAGVVWFEGQKVGMERRAVGIKEQRKLEGGISPLYFTTIEEDGVYGNYFMRTQTEWAQIHDRRIIRNGFFWSDGTGRPISTGFEAEVFCLGGPDVMLYLCEFGDFFVGWFGLDPRSDDVPASIGFETGTPGATGTAMTTGAVEEGPSDDELARLREQLAQAQKEIAELRKKLESYDIRTGDQGEIVISMLADTLYAPGKAALTDEGKAELDRVMKVVRDQFPDRELMVRGHTDTQPIVYSGWKSNWELGAARSLGVLHYLTEEHGVKGEKISAATYSYFRPRADNATAEGRQQNRRAELVVLPAADIKVEAYGG